VHFLSLTEIKIVGIGPTNLLHALTEEQLTMYQKSQFTSYLCRKVENEHFISQTAPTANLPHLKKLKGNLEESFH
jgi:hypothetical protein